MDQEPFILFPCFKLDKIQRSSSLIPIHKPDFWLGNGGKLKNDSVLLGAMSLDMLAVLFGGAVALLPIFASDILKIGPQGLGWLRTAPSVGSALMSLTLLGLPPIRHAGKILIGVVFGFGLS